MKTHVLVLVAHPSPDSFSAAIAHELHNAAGDSGGEAKLIDLYNEGFDPLLKRDEAVRNFSFDEKVLAYQKDVAGADVLVWVHPDWWGGMPAVLKGWLDRVLLPGFAFSFEEDSRGTVSRIPLLKKKSGLAVITSDALPTEPVPAADMWQKRVFPYCGFGPGEVLVLPETRQTEYLRRREFLAACRETLQRLMIPDTPAPGENA